MVNFAAYAYVDVQTCTEMNGTRADMYGTCTKMYGTFFGEADMQMVKISGTVKKQSQVETLG